MPKELKNNTLPSRVSSKPKNIYGSLPGKINNANTSNSEVFKILRKAIKDGAFITQK